MTDGPNAHFDSRFDPLFQRGFGTDDARDDLAFDPHSATAANSTTRASRTSTGPEGATPALNDAIVDDIAVEPTPTDAAPRSTTTNGFLVALVAVAAALVAAGVWLFGAVRQAFDDPGAFRAESDYFALMSAAIVAPLLVMLGFATGIGVLFVYATAGRQSR